MPSPVELLEVICRVNQRLVTGQNVSLERVSEVSGWSAGHLHRALRGFTGESLKRFTGRRQMELAAGLLLKAPPLAVHEVAEQTGFASHEVFTRAFRRHFDCTPSDFRRTRRRHTHGANGACLNLYRTPLTRSQTMSEVEISLRNLEPTTILYREQRITVDGIASFLGECLPQVFAYCQKEDLQMVGPPIAHYLEATMGSLTVRGGLPVAATSRPPSQGIQLGELPGGWVACATHVGPYDLLRTTHAALETWMQANQHRSRGGPWEVYVTDPGDVPNPEAWRTDIFHPILVEEPE